MRPFIFIILFLSLNTVLYSQESQPKNFFFNEFYFNGNVYLPQQGNKFWGGGVGLGMVRVAFKESNENLVFGMELNTFRTYSSSYSDDKYSSAKNVKATFLSINLPLMARFHIGTSKRLYAQAGFSADLNLAAVGSGLFSSHGPTSEIPTIVDQPSNSIGLETKPSFTVRAGLGYNILVKKRNCALQVDYFYNGTPVIQGEFAGKFQSQYLRLIFCVISFK